jgi:hypothetical protein
VAPMSSVVTGTAPPVASGRVGYVTEYGGDSKSFAFATVNNAGHEVCAISICQLLYRCTCIVACFGSAHSANRLRFDCTRRCRLSSHAQRRP